LQYAALESKKIFDTVFPVNINTYYHVTGFDIVSVQSTSGTVACYRQQAPEM